MRDGAYQMAAGLGGQSKDGTDIWSAGSADAAHARLARPIRIHNDS